MRIIDKPESHYTYIFDTWEEMVLQADKSGGPSERSRAEDDWFGSQTFPDAIRMGLEGLPVIGRQIKEDSGNIASIIFASMPKPDVDYSTSGQIIDMGKYLDGLPECCLKLDVPDSGGSRIVDIVVNASINCNQNADAVKNRGTAIAVIIRTLESLGVSTRVWITYGFHRDQTIQIWTKFKDYGEPLRLNHLAVALCSPITHRRFGFSLAESAPDAIKESIGIRNGGSYGGSYDIESWSGQNSFPVKPGYLYFPILSGQSEFKSLDSSKTWAEEQIKSKYLKTEVK